MNLLYRYSKQYWTLFIVALLLAATNQIFSLLDPLIFRHVIDNYATKYHDYTQGQFIRGAGLLLLAAMGVAFRDFADGSAVNRPRMRYLARHPDPRRKYLANVHVGAVPSAGIACVRAGSQIITPP